MLLWRDGHISQSADYFAHSAPLRGAKAIIYTRPIEAGLYLHAEGRKETRSTAIDAPLARAWHLTPDFGLGWSIAPDGSSQPWVFRYDAVSLGLSVSPEN